MTTWHNTAEIAARVQRSVSTIRLAAVLGDLHGHQPMRNGQPLRKGKWLFAAPAVDAWIQGLDERAQREACGCSRLQVARRGAA